MAIGLDWDNILKYVKKKNHGKNAFRFKAVNDEVGTKQSITRERVLAYMEFQGVPRDSMWSKDDF